ncbi:hypothetical protein B1C78_10735 [Thioalkalivibrio denitrificans]|uniref:Uncharacterized protein n=1 Tax=Thioalkalivibrio denitrificans TaxID=108003 RepID=A0A1V3NFN4_9GAMM|nr:hypothetical protein [Thioalkalivibrio denitrificans]OOG23596.1 hypothetical protein B1C78_10735 [Thioalkalivibrio denitrificans]
MKKLLLVTRNFPPLCGGLGCLNRDLTATLSRHLDVRVIVPFSLAFFLVGLGYHPFISVTMGRFTNMNTLLLTTSVVIFLIGLVFEQNTQLIYNDGVAEDDPAASNGHQK